MPTSRHSMPPFADRAPRPAYQNLAGEDLLWQRWHLQRDDSARETLARHYLAYARALAAQIYRRRITDELEFDEYLQFATVGMMESLDRFDPSHGVLFKTFATRRIVGAILSGVAALSERQQQLTLRRRVAGERTASLYAELPAEDNPELILRELASVGVGLALGFILEGTGMVKGGEEARPDNTYAQLELKQFQERIVHVVKKLTAREEEVVRLHYFHGSSFDDIAERLGLSKGRISQLHKQALSRLRALLGETERCDLQL